MMFTKVEAMLVAGSAFTAGVLLTATTDYQYYQFKLERKQAAFNEQISRALAEKPQPDNPPLDSHGQPETLRSLDQRLVQTEMELAPRGDIKRKLPARTTNERVTVLEDQVDELRTVLETLSEKGVRPPTEKPDG